ncbi:peptidase M20 [Ligilactobacillus sp. WILCCON 0076]|uniref:Peptidase M20 n=1 Tax=Ligilactobacillus ubinensis TaxID=2876789 RepID=A0A9X2FIL6_9LACO|nr:M28 family peptidase [Ligilactobacillus ubinensis]MCP0886567.1 peptidase M20 [Ligilactobacillus ubinensis]
MRNKFDNSNKVTLVEKITRELVAVKSINGTNGEIQVVKKVEEILRDFPVFKKHPEWVWTQKLPNDPLGRQNVFAFLPKSQTNKTVIYHSHLDTVGVKDFGALEPHALNSEKLTEYFKNYTEDADVKKDAESGDWLFGRGALDMKSGDAVNLSNLYYFSQHPEEQTGNLVFMGNCVEENDHSGVIAALSELQRLKDENYLDYQVAINTDFISPKFSGDKQKYIYYGAAGKVLTCFYIKGIETHVGNTYAGLDSTLIASHINVLLNNNPDFIEKIAGEEILPSSCLMLRDQKDFYNVQTAKKTYMYFNTFTYARPVADILFQIKNAVKQECDILNTQAKRRYANFLEQLHFPEHKEEQKLKVFTFAEYIEYLKTKGLDTRTLMQDFYKEHQNLDKREAGFELIDWLDTQVNDGIAKVILFVAPPFCPHNSVEKTSHVYTKLQAVLDSAKNDERFVMKQFFPYLSDSSYLKVDESEKELELMQANFPLANELYPLPYDKMRELNIPAVDIGVYGKGAHTWKERVYKPYSYEVLPPIIREYTKKMWKEE